MQRRRRRGRKRRRRRTKKKKKKKKKKKGQKNYDLREEPLIGLMAIREKINSLEYSVRMQRDGMKTQFGLKSMVIHRYPPADLVIVELEPKQTSKPNFRRQTKFLFGLITFRTWRVVVLVFRDKEIVEKKYANTRILSFHTVNSQRC
jgi:hypothetical protein